MCIELIHAIVGAGEAEIEVSLESDTEIEVVPKIPTRGKAAGKKAAKKPAAAGRGAKVCTFSAHLCFSIFHDILVHEQIEPLY